MNPPFSESDPLCIHSSPAYLGHTCLQTSDRCVHLPTTPRRWRSYAHRRGPTARQVGAAPLTFSGSEGETEEFHPFRKVQSPGFWTFSKQPMLLLDQATQLVFLASTKAGGKPARKYHVHCGHTREAIQTWFPSLFSLRKCP